MNQPEDRSSDPKPLATVRKYVDRGPRWGHKKGQPANPGSGIKPRTPTVGTPVQMQRQFQAFEFHLRSFTNKEISELLHVREQTVSKDIEYEYERRRPIFASGREAFIQRSFHALEGIKQMNFEVLTRNFGESKSGLEYKAILSAIALQARLMGYEAPKKIDARIEGQLDIGSGLPEVSRQLPESIATSILYAIANAAGRGGDSRLGAPQWNVGPVEIGAGTGVVEHIGPGGEVDIIEHGTGDASGVGSNPTR